MTPIPVQLNVSLHPDDRDDMKAAARRAGMHMSDFIVSKCLGRPALMRVDERKALRARVRELEQQMAQDRGLE
jgi:uncharacterized protein (DUF1778 family)